MPLYTFYCWRADGTAASAFEAREHATDAQALAHARRVLSDHASCARVEVFEGDRLIGETSDGD